MDSIIYLSRNDLDVQRYNDCINNASNGVIYAYSDYLDTMAVQWGALVYNDYAAVMPLTWNKKYGIHYIYNPPFTACLGVFGNNIGKDLITAFFNAVPRKFKYWDFSLNHGNYFETDHYPMYQRRNFILYLQPDYTTLYAGFRQNIKRNIARAAKHGCYSTTGIAVTEVIQLAKAQLTGRTKIKDEDFEKLANLYAHLKSQDKAITYGIFDQNKMLLASAVFFFSHRRAYYILAGNHPNGRTMGASHFLINSFIEDHAGQNLYLDFEGSDIHHLAFFYSSFGATEESYAGIRLNRLPFYLKWFKK